jgi:hypothetical protein
MPEPSSPPAHPPAEPLLVACLCAQWCRVCGEYGAVFDGAARDAAPGERFLWVDIEDDEQVLGPLDVDNFPTLLIARGAAPLFFGALTPQPGTLARLLQSAREGDLRPRDDAAAQALVQRVRSFAAAGGGARG